jgi:hypothetical protein
MHSQYIPYESKHFMFCISQSVISKFLFKTSRETKIINNSYIFSQALLESICDGDLFLTSGGDGSDDNDDDDDFESVAINQNTHAIVRNVCILQMLLKDWSLIRKADFDVQEILWQALETLVRPTHPHVKFNVVQFQRARIVENLLTGCQV